MSSRDKTLIVGAAGQVGRALTKVLCKKYKVLEHDINKKKIDRDKYVEINIPPENAQGLIMHVCFPYDENFIAKVREYSKAYNPKLIIIHSSLKPGTTSLLGDLPVVHSPVIFDENNFYSIAMFRKMIGYDEPVNAIMAEEHLRPVFNTAMVCPSNTTELSDLCMNLYAMTCKSVTYEISRMFDISGLDYRIMIEAINYNNMGYASINKVDMMVMNQVQDVNRAAFDFRTKLIDLLPEELMSAFFKLSKKSYDIEIESRNKMIKQYERKVENDTSRTEELPEKIAV